MNIEEIRKLTKQGEKDMKIACKKAGDDRLQKEKEAKNLLENEAKKRSVSTVEWLKVCIKDSAKQGKSSYKTHFGETDKENELYHEILKDLVKKKLKDFSPEFTSETVECNNDSDLWSETAITPRKWYIYCLYLTLKW